MARSEADATTLAMDALSALDSRLNPQSGTMGRLQRYLSGDHDLPYQPKGAGTEYRRIAERSRTPWLPLVSDTFAKGLWVDGYRPARQTENSRPWAYWQANGLDARQSIAHRGALEYGVSYVVVLPGDPSPVIRPVAPMKAIAFYEDDADEWPDHALTVTGRTLDGSGRLFRLYDRTSVYSFRLGGTDTQGPVLLAVEDHGAGVTPVVRFRERLDGEAVGIIWPLLPLQDRVNETVFSLLIALQYASFRQRWATGLAIPVDETTGAPVEPFEAAVDRLWISDSPEAKFGDFAQTDTRGHLDAYLQSVRTLAAVAQIPPDMLLGDVANISAEALAAFQATTQRKTDEFATIFGESWEQALRLAAALDGDAEAAADTSSQVRWRDTEARSLATTVDALGKMVQMLGVPAEAAWERIPGVTDQDVERWRGMASTGDGLQALADALTRQTAPAIDAGATTTGG